MMPVNAVLDAVKVNLPMRIVEMDAIIGVDKDGCQLVDAANACIVRGRLVTVGHLDKDLPASSVVNVIEPRTGRIEKDFFRKRSLKYDAAILEGGFYGRGFEPAPPVIGEDVVLSHYYWDDDAGKSKFVMAAGKLVALVDDVQTFDSKDNSPILLEGVNVHSRYAIRAPLCPWAIRCGSGVTNRKGQLIGIINGIAKVNPDLLYMSSITDILAACAE